MEDNLFKIEWTELSKRDYDNLDGSEKIFVNKGLKKIQAFGMQAGTELHGDLASCRKLKNRKLGLRIIFRESANAIEVIQIVAIGKREAEGRS
ncbi:MAG: addiction module toxin RelE [Clostridiales Family XIII bacterium]|jgi:mRNA interferase RelE/StbE|nr:addiction module toxin RelE [Clostridiales Family XIII bacterium]